VEDAIESVIDPISEARIDASDEEGGELIKLIETADFSLDKTYIGRRRKIRKLIALTIIEIYNNLPLNIQFQLE